MSFILPLNVIREELEPIGEKFNQFCGALSKQETLALLETEEGKRIIQDDDLANMPNLPKNMCIAKLRIVDGPDTGKSIELRCASYGSMMITDAKLANYEDNSPMVILNNLSFTISANTDLLSGHKAESQCQTELNLAVNRAFDHLVPFPFSFEWLIHYKPGEVCSGLCLHQTAI